MGTPRPQHARRRPTLLARLNNWWASTAPTPTVPPPPGRPHWTERPTASPELLDQIHAVTGRVASQDRTPITQPTPIFNELSMEATQ